MLGTSYRQDEQILFDKLQTGISAMQAAAVGPLAGFQPGLANMNAALVAFKASSTAKNSYLSNTNYGK